MCALLKLFKKYIIRWNNYLHTKFCWPSLISGKAKTKLYYYVFIWWHWKKFKENAIQRPPHMWKAVPNSENSLKASLITILNSRKFNHSPLGLDTMAYNEKTPVDPVSFWKHSVMVYLSTLTQGDHSVGQSQGVGQAVNNRRQPIPLLKSLPQTGTDTRMRN